MTVATLINILLELDQQWISLRPSEWGKAAELVRDLAEAAEPSMRDPDKFGPWEDIDLSPVLRQAPRDLDQPALDELQARSRPRTVIRRAGGKFDIFFDAVEAEKFRRRMISEGYAVEATNVEAWTEH